MKLLLDTSTFLWFLTGDKRISEAVRRQVISEESQVFLSCVSLWEIVVKHSLGKLPLPEPPTRYIPMQRERHRIESLPLIEAAVSHLPKLPPLHRDPFDRILICQCLEHGLRLVTNDPMIAAYPVPTLWN